MPRLNKLGPPKGSIGTRDGTGKGKGRNSGAGIGAKKGGKRGTCPKTGNRKR